MDDARLLARCVQGDKVALATLYDRHASSVFAYALRLVGERSAAEDVTQETFMALAGGVRFDPSRSFDAWLLTVTRNEAFDLLRRRKRRREVPMEGGTDVAAAPSADPAAAEAVEWALRSVPAEFREALWLCDAMEMSYREASEVMGCEVGTVGSRVARGRQLLREQFARSGHAV